MDFLMDYLKLNQLRVKNSRLFIRYLLSYVIVLLIPLLILTLLLYSYFFHVLEGEVVKNNDSILEHVQYEVDTRINEMNKMAFQIYNNEALSTYKVSNNPVDAYKGIALLENYIVGSNFIDNVALYYGQINEIYTSSRTYPVDDFMREFLPSGWTEEQFHKQTEIQANTITVPNRKDSLLKKSHYITYFIPDGSGSRYDPKMVMFIIRDAAFDQMLVNNKGDIFVVDNNSLVVAGPNINADQPLQRPMKLDDLTGSGFRASDYVVSKRTSADTGWTYIIRMPISQAMHEVTVVKSVFIYALVILVIIVGFIIFFVTRYNYKPIQLLKQFAETKTGTNLETKNEIDAVRQSIENMSIKNTILNEKVKNNHDAIKEFTLLNLLKGHCITMSEFNEKAKDIGVSFTHAHYFVTVLNCTASNPSISHKEIIHQLENEPADDLEGFGVDNIDSNIIFIWASSQPSFSVLNDRLNRLRVKLNDQFCIQMTVGVGKCYSQTDQIGKSYIEAFTALDYRLIKGKNKILYFEEALLQGTFIKHYPVNELKSLELHMMEGNTEQINQVVSGVINQIIQDDLPLFEARCLCFDIINTVLKTMFVINKEFSSIRDSDLDVMALTKFETVGELGNAIKTVCAKTCQYIQENKNDHTQTLTNQFIAYIKENFKDPNFTVQGMAEHFKMSMPNLSYYFKKETDQNVSDYINYYRIERAKELLTSTKKNLNEIIYEIGYYDVSSFIKKFKQQVGTTPGMFRKLAIKMIQNDV